MTRQLIAALLIAVCGNALAANPVLRIRIPSAGLAAPAAKPEVPPPGVLVPPGTPEPVPPNTPVFTLSKAVLEFGTVKVWESSDMLAVTATNTGTAPLTIDYVERPYDAFNAPQANPQNCTTGTVLPVGGTCQVRVSFNPYQEGPQTEEMFFETSGGNITLELRGTGLGAPQPLDVLQAPSGVLGTYLAGTTSGMGSYEYVFKNNTAITLTGTSVVAISGSSGRPVGTFGGNTCLGSIVPTATCSLTFTPNEAAPGDIVLSFAETSKQTKVSYTIIGESPRIVFVSTSVTGMTKTYLIKNPNTVVPVTFASITLVDKNYVNNAKSFNVNGCIGTTLAAGATCSMAVTYVPGNGVQTSVNVMPVILTPDGPTTVMTNSPIWW